MASQPGGAMPFRQNKPNNGQGVGSKKRPSENSSSGNANKRPKTGEQNGGARKSKIHTIRAIAAQYPDDALKDGELDMQAFINARSFEIKALDESMRRTTTSQTSRAFQKVPFSLRRRAAAHNHKRVPKRLQKRARKEMVNDNTPTVSARTRKPASTRARLRAETAKRLGKLVDRKRKKSLQKHGELDPEIVQVRAARPKIRRNALNSPLVSEKKFKKRQLDKTWLPTHLWLAKRARMTKPKEPLWRFAIPITPNAKVYRTTHRAHWEKGAIAWDMSYMSTISLCGITRCVEQVLRSLGLTEDWLWNDKPKGQDWRSGASHWSTTLSRKKGVDSRTIGPATIIWNPEETDEATAETTKTRRLFIRVHPSVFLETFNELLRLAKGVTPKPYVEDLRYEIGSIDVTGPSATEALSTVLKSYYSKPALKEAHAAKFESLGGRVEPSSLPAGSLLAFSAMDPRLQHPPRRLPTSKENGLGVETVAKCRSKDTPHPSFPPATSNTRPFRRPRYLDSHAALEVRSSSLVQPHALSVIDWRERYVWGVNELRQLAFEQKVPWFPGDIVGSDAGIVWELQQRQERKSAWDRMPKGKRVNYDTLDLGAGRKGEIGSGWSCDYETLLGMQAQTGLGAEDVTMADAADETADATAFQASKGSHSLQQVKRITKAELQSYWASKNEQLPPFSVVTVRVTFLSRGTPDTCARIYRLPKEQPASTQAEVPATEPPTKRNNDSKLPVDIRKQWLAQIPQSSPAGRQGKPKKPPKFSVSSEMNPETRKRLLAQELLKQPPTSYPPGAPTQDTINGHPLCPDAEDLIGFVTAGSYHLRTGQSEGIATISAAEAVQHKTGEGLCVVRNVGQNVGWVARWKLV
ncbi:ribonucleases P/MRP protein subunit POP1-domain-containing protein [Apiospora saccharicola]|uniref:Ribonucleases P/MRP protein subunit POP1-domain-containing protein n=1 Tax=Apiospora saccharicola TaxID=335842 RepID=A0ABR1VCI6_9PEZI